MALLPVLLLLSDLGLVSSPVSDFLPVKAASLTRALRVSVSRSQRHAAHLQGDWDELPKLTVWFSPPLFLEDSPAVSSFVFWKRSDWELVGFA